MSGQTCEFCGNAAMFVIREMEGAEARERHVCAAHALDVDLPPGNYVLGDRTFPSFADLVAAVGGTPAGKFRPVGRLQAQGAQTLTPTG